MTDRAQAIVTTVRRHGSWLGELSGGDIQELRRAGLKVHIFNQKSNGQWACEVTI